MTFGEARRDQSLAVERGTPGPEGRELLAENLVLVRQLVLPVRTFEGVSCLEGHTLDNPAKRRKRQGR